MDGSTHVLRGTDPDGEDDEEGDGEAVMQTIHQVVIVAQVDVCHVRHDVYKSIQHRDMLTSRLSMMTSRHVDVDVTS